MKNYISLSKSKSILENSFELNSKYDIYLFISFNKSINYSLKQSIALFWYIFVKIFSSKLLLNTAIILFRVSTVNCVLLSFSSIFSLNIIYCFDLKSSYLKANTTSLII